MSPKDERAEFDSSSTINVIRVCTNNQGGLLDTPGLVTAACGNVLDKVRWCLLVLQKVPSEVS